MQFTSRQTKCGGTTVFTFDFFGDARPGVDGVEAIVHRHEPGQVTVCLSTQDGCAGGCVFCGASPQVRQLSAEQIVQQFDLAVNTLAIDPCSVQLSVEFIVLGEPMHNFANVSTAIRTLYGRYPQARFVFCSIVPKVPVDRYEGLYQLLVDVPTMEWHVSLHFTDEGQRNEHIQLKAKLSITEVSSLGRQMHERGGVEGRLVFNYIVRPELNDRLVDLARLQQLFPACIWAVKVSVLCQDGIDVEIEKARMANYTAALAWYETLSGAGYNARLYNPKGQEIGGGSGLLRAQQQNID